VTVHEEPVFASFLDPVVLDDPFEAFAELRARCPVHRQPENGQYMITRHADARTVLGDTATFSNQAGASRAIAGGAAAAQAEVFARDGWVRARTLQRTDPPVHTRYRRLLSRVFTPRRVQDLSPRITEIANLLVDRFIDEGRCEFVHDFALPLPGILICEQLGLPADEYPTFRRWADAMLAMGSRPLSVEEAVEQATIEVEAQHHLAREFDDRRANPRDDIISALVHAHGDDDEPLSMEELQDLMQQMITGGFETTTAALGTGMMLLLQHPEQLAMLRADRSMMRNFVEESLRFDSPVSGLWRSTTCPVSIAGTEIPQGAMVMVRYASANRDEAVFANADSFDITRSDVGQHLAFGFGNHFCLGAALARAELEIAFGVLLDRLDDLAVAEPLDDLPHEYSYFLRPLKRLPLSFARR
jgi:cytochrome P450